MSTSFEKARDLVLLALLDFLRTENVQEWFAPHEIRKKSKVLSGAFVKRAADSLYSGNLVDRELSEDGEQAVYRLSDAGIEAAEQVERRDGLLKSVIEQAEAAIPASDRVVSINDNQPEWIEIRDAAKSLSEQLIKGNDIGDLTADEAEAAYGEVENLVNFMSRPKIRTSAVHAAAIKTLRWIGEKAAGAAVGKAALHLLALIGVLFGF